MNTLRQTHIMAQKAQMHSFFLVPVRLEAVMSHKSELSFESFIFKGMNIRPIR